MKEKEVYNFFRITPSYRLRIKNDEGNKNENKDVFLR